MISAVCEHVSCVSVLPSQVLKLFVMYTVYSSIHSAAAFIYSKYCANFSWRGIILNPLFTITPQCKGLRWLMSSTQDGIVSWWLTAATWTISNINWITGSKRDPVVRS
tara:strand:- start:861 stop:1184 length:324 start_codon:yes stop_codon:yes gene_type:complete